MSCSRTPKLIASLAALFSVSTLATTIIVDRDSIDLVPESTFTQGVEGPVVGPNGHLYAVNFRRQGTIGQVDEQGYASLFVTLPPGSTGNGLRIDHNKQLYVADYTGHNILKINLDNKAVSVHAHNSAMNQPNDIAIMNDGTLFASDPNWSNNTGQLWRVSPDGATQLVESDMGTTNGVAVSPNQRHLYVNESVQRKVWIYDIDNNRQLVNKRLLIAFKDFGLDGMRCDKQGNLFIARYGAGEVIKVSPQGELLKHYALKGEFPTNVAFSNDQSTLFVTMQKRGNIELLKL